MLINVFKRADLGLLWRDAVDGIGISEVCRFAMGTLPTKEVLVVLLPIKTWREYLANTVYISRCTGVAFINARFTVMGPVNLVLLPI